MEKKKTMFEELKEMGAVVHTVMAGVQFIKFVEPINETMLFVGNAYIDGDVVGNNVMGPVGL